MLSLMAAAALACTVTDGDTIRCGDERIRLIGIDAPELPGHCRRGRVCVSGDGAASRESLREGMKLGRIEIDRLGTDRYGRTLATVLAGETNLSCWQLARGHAAYIMKWDDGLATLRACPASSLKSIH